MKEQNELDELIKDSKDLVRLHKKRGDDLNGIFMGFYSDPSHFVYELLQNADDSGAKKVELSLSKDRLEIFHNGSDFNFENVRAITGIGNSTKKDDYTAIGHFGVGFKSVFAVTDSPIIYSGEYKFKIVDLFVPEIIERSDSDKGTKIILPFKHKERTSDWLHQATNEQLKHIDLTSLLFLKNITSIAITADDYKKTYKRTEENILSEDVYAAYVNLCDDKKIYKTYLMFSKPVEIQKNSLKVQIAFKIDTTAEGKTLIKKTHSKLFVFFETQLDTHLNFLVNGPFVTTVNRENIPLDNEQNRLISKAIADLVAQSIPIAKDLGFLNVELLEALPIEQEFCEKSKFYLGIFESVKKIFLSESKLIPTADGQFTDSKSAVLARSKELLGLLDSADLKELFSRSHWVNTEITENKARKLHSYLKQELRIPEVDFESFTNAKKLTAEFLGKKPDEWIIKFYLLLKNHQGLLWRGKDSPIYRKPIIRVIRQEKEEHVPPGEAYLPSETSSRFPTVKRSLFKNEDILTFMENLGIKKPDISAEIESFIIPKYTKSEICITEVENRQDIKYLCELWEKIPAGKKEGIIEKLQQVSVLNSIYFSTGEIKRQRPDLVYFQDPDLLKYFGKQEKVYFLYNDLYSECDKEKLINFLKSLGVSDSPRRILIKEEKPNYLRPADLKNNENIGSSTVVNTQDAKLQGLEEFLAKELSIEDSLLLWRILVKCINNHGGDNPRSFFEGIHKWSYYGEHSKTFDASFLDLLKSTAWIFDQKSIRSRAYEIYFSDINSQYDKDALNVEVLAEKLAFIPDVYAQLPSEDREKLEIARAFSPEELQEAIEEHQVKKEKAKEKWQPQIAPSEIKPITHDITSNLENRPVIVEPSLRESKHGSGVEYKKEKFDPETQKAVGAWAEEHVLQHLKEEYSPSNDIEIDWLNKNGDSGEGCDFIIMKGNKEFEYIEVKAKQSESEEWVRITGRQWEFANGLFNNNEGDKYWIYVVENAGTQNVVTKKLRNPVKLWKEGKLYAHPINLKL